MGLDYRHYEEDKEMSRQLRKEMGDEVFDYIPPEEPITKIYYESDDKKCKSPKRIAMNVRIASHLCLHACPHCMGWDFQEKWVKCDAQQINSK
jgi:hypothetical protein